ncbi:MAG: MMPL family transporter, partial [Acidimicrobiia bacterium]
MIRLADFCYRKRRFVLLAWIVALVVIVGIGSSVGSEHRANYQTPGAEATKAYQLLGERFPARAGDAINVVFRADAGIDDPQVKSRVEKLIATIQAIPDATQMVSRTVSPYDPEGAAQVSQDRKIAFIEVDFDRTQDKVFNEDVKYPKK